MHKNIWINWSVEFGPIVLFFVSLKILGENPAGFVFSTALFTGATILALLIAYLQDKRIALFPIISGVFVVAFGITTVYFNQPYVFIIKDSIYNGFFAILLLIGIIKKKGLLKPFFGALFDITDEGWKILSFRWMIMFILLLVSNEFVWRTFSLEVWVMYKFIATITTIVFGSYQIFLAKKFRNPTASAWGMRIVNNKNIK
jgi:intracellular septation protein